jgi:hypothetical protein
MARLRMLLAWLLLLAIPLQGLAAASMMYCGPAPQAAQAHQLQSAHEHEHGHGHDADATSASAYYHAKHDQVASDAGQHPAGTSSAADGDHKCSLCAACQVVGISDSPHTSAFSAAPQIPWVESFIPVHSRPTAVPDKPPRA